MRAAQFVNYSWFTIFFHSDMLDLIEQWSVVQVMFAVFFKMQAAEYIEVSHVTHRVFQPISILSIIHLRQFSHSNFDYSFFAKTKI